MSDGDATKRDAKYGLAIILIESVPCPLLGLRLRHNGDDAAVIRGGKKVAIDRLVQAEMLDAVVPNGAGKLRVIHPSARDGDDVLPMGQSSSEGSDSAGARASGLGSRPRHCCSSSRT